VGQTQWTDVLAGGDADDHVRLRLLSLERAVGFWILQKAVLINPLVYASEGFRSALAPNFPHLSVAANLGALVAFDVLFLTVGLRQFRKKAVT
jgi:ABC-type polysaccharide/polyol phosphate export permease